MKAIVRQAARCNIYCWALAIVIFAVLMSCDTIR